MNRTRSFAYSWAQAGGDVGVPKTTVQTWIKKRKIGSVLPI